MGTSITNVTKTTEESGGFFSRIPWYYQMLMLLVLVGVLFWVIDIAFYSEQRTERDKILKEVNELREKNKQGEIIRQNIAAAEKTLEEKKKEIGELRELLPDQVEI